MSVRKCLIDFKCCVDMPRRNTSQRLPEEVTNDKLRCGRVQNSTSSARGGNKQYSLLWLVEGEGGTRLGRVDVAGGSTSQTGLSHMVDPTQYQQHYEVYQQTQNQAYYKEPQQYHFDMYQRHQYHHDIKQEQPDIEQEQPDIKQEHPQ